MAAKQRKRPRKPEHFRVRNFLKRECPKCSFKGMYLFPDYTDGFKLQCWKAGCSKCRSGYIEIPGASKRVRCKTCWSKRCNKVFILAGIEPEENK